MGTREGNPTAPATEEDIKSPRLVAAERAKKRALQNQDLSADFSFGKVLKYLIIFFIIFAILFFVGSQIFAISRGGRKRR